MAVSIENPWWNEGGLWQDSDLARVKQSPLRYLPRPFRPEECQTSSVMTLRGPRRAGKTVSLKLLVAELIEAHQWDPRAIVWTSFDTFRTLAQIEDHLSVLMAKYHPRILFVDEVTAVSGWQRVIKKLRDNGILEKCCVILTGSSAHDLKAGAERMAGRRGDVINPDRVLLPMGFSDFVKQVKVPAEQAIQDYLRVGGFPFRVEQYLNGNHEELAGFQIFDDALFYEFSRRRLDRTIAIEVIERLSAIQCSAISYESFIKPLSIAKDTARKYLTALGDSFLLATVSSFDTSKNRVAPKKDRKFIWVDPALGYFAPWLHRGSVASEASRAEWAVGIEILRRFETRLFEGLSAPTNVFTWKSSGGNEIDYLILDKTEKIRLPVEVKYQNSISDWDFQVMERAFGGGIMVTLNTTRGRPKSRALSVDQFLVQKDWSESARSTEFK